MDEKARDIRLQILSMENSTLLAQRAQMWADASGRATMFLAVLSGAVVAIALAAQATGFNSRSLLFPLLLLPVVLFVGITTLGRITEINNEDLRLALALSRIRAGLLEIDPGAAAYLAVNPIGDWEGISQQYGVRVDDTPRNNVVHGLRTLPALFAVINSVVAAVLVGVVALALGSDPVVAVTAGLAVFVLAFTGQMRMGIRSVAVMRRELEESDPV